MPSKSTWLEILKEFPSSEVEIGDDRISSAFMGYFDLSFLGGRHCRLAQGGLPVDELPAVAEVWYDDLSLWWSEPQVGKGSYVRPASGEKSRVRVTTERCYVFPWEHLISVTRIEVKGWESVFEEDTDDSRDGDDAEGTDDSLDGDDESCK